MKAFKLSLVLGLAAGAFAAPTDSTTDTTDTTEDADNSLSFDNFQAPTSVDTSQSNCKAVTFNIFASALNRNLTGVPLGNVTDLFNFVQNAPLIPVSGNQTIAGTYCTPLTKNANNEKIEILSGSITADRNGWSAQGGVGTTFPQYQPERYSWQAFANALGYHTLHIDRLGTGTSSHPDPILVVQAPYEEALYSNLANMVRNGAPQLNGKKFQRLIYVGNSYGSQLGAGIAGAYPKAYDEFVLTGFSKDPQQDFLGVAMVDPAPAAVFDPARFGGLSPGYLTSTSEVGRTNSFFGSKAQVSFSDTVADLFFKRENTVSIGQFASVYGLIYSGAGFKGRVFTLTGEQDQAFCGPGSPVIGPAMCGPQLQETGVLFPDADYNFQSVNRTGHAIQLHYTSLKVYSIAHAFLAGVEFKGGPPL